MGLKESPGKEQFAHQTPEGCEEMRRQGIEPTKVKYDLKAIGATLAPAKGRTIAESELKRLEGAAAKAKKVAILPVSWGRKIYISCVQ